MPQGDYIELHQKRHGKRPDFEERKRKREARSVKKISKDARNLLGAKGKRFAKKRYAEKAQMKKTLKMHDESTSRQKVDDDVEEGALPPYLLDRIRRSVPRFSATQLSKRERKRLANGMFLCPRLDLLLKKRCSKFYGLERGKPSSGREW